ncbi:uncharacterized protein LOC127720222 [Mytilus californianus]|uniref:uncharacterized protein LOC127720222 n=1 Tax=Mytilus californianus TaxID=6549 RepID=UPI0022467E98|nr:uncharacterized protein LOC127720222 [Mytilus californianus]
MAAISREESNYIKIALLVLRISPPAVRVKFDIEFHPERLRKTLDENFPKLQALHHKKKINKDQWDLLFPLRGKGEISSQNFDITLMMFLIRNLTEITISSILPLPFQIGLSDDLTRIHFYRNKIAHVEDATISDTDFSKYWDDITEAIIRLGGEVLRERCSELQEQIFNVDESENHLRQLQVELRLTAVENKVMELTDKMSYIEEEQKDPIPKNIRDLIKKQIEGWKSKDNFFFIKTKRSEYALQRVVENSCVVLTGGPGVGKTFIARHIALMLEQKGYRIIPVLTPKDIRKFYQQGKKSIFIIDDMCGTYTANQREMENWQQLSPVIKTILEDESCKIILSCRLQVYLDERFKLLSPFQDCECNLMAKSLRKKEIKQMIERYNISTKVLSMESRKYECFPLLCSLHHESERVDTMEFFQNPFEIYKTELNNLGKSSFDGKYRLCGLALCVLLNNNINEKWFQSKVAHDEEKMLEDAYGACGLNRGTSKALIGEAFSSLEGTYVCKQNGIYTTLHDKLFDFLVYYFGQKMLQCLIEHGDSNLIRERFRWRRSTENIGRGIEFITEIPDHSLQMFLDRLIKDWSEGRVSIVFYNNNLKNKYFREKILQYLEQLDKTDQVKLANTMDTMYPKGDSCAGNYPIIDVCYQGYTDLLQWLLHNDVNVNQRREDGVTPLIMASAYGYLDIVTMLLRHNPDANLYNVNKVTALYMACQNNHLFVVEELLKIEINVDLCDEQNQSPLFVACRSGWNATVKKLLQKSPNVNQESKAGSNPLQIACLFGHTDVVTLLLTSKNVDININTSDLSGYTPLINACFRNFTEITSLLINAKADVDIQTTNGATALCLAVGYNNLETTELLLKNNASWQIGFRNRQQMIDAMPKHPDITLDSVKDEIRNFVVKNASQKVTDYVNKQSGDYIFNAIAGSSPLHIASFMGHTNIVSCLLNFDAYVDFAKEDGTTPLFYACELGHDDIVRLLLNNGAEANIRRLDTRSPLDVAEYNGHRSVVTMLREQGVD